MSTGLKAALRSRLPRLFLALRDLRYRLRPERPDPSLTELLTRLSPGALRVQSGPFAAMTYLPQALGSGLLPKIAGTYEAELHPVLERAIGRRPRRLVNIGAAEGYYAVGLARRLPELAVYAFDLEPLALRRLPALAAANGVAGRVQFENRCTPARLAVLAGPGCLVVCDCEGCEAALLDPRQAPALAAADLLVELHRAGDPGRPEAVLARFATSHHCELIEAQPPPGSLPPQLAARLRPEEHARVTDEGRIDGFLWAWLTPRQR